MLVIATVSRDVRRQNSDRRATKAQSFLSQPPRSSHRIHRKCTCFCALPPKILKCPQQSSPLQRSQPITMLSIALSPLNKFQVLLHQSTSPKTKRNSSKKARLKRTLRKATLKQRPFLTMPVNSMSRYGSAIHVPPEIQSLISAPAPLVFYLDSLLRLPAIKVSPQNPPNYPSYASGVPWLDGGYQKGRIVRQCRRILGSLQQHHSSLPASW